MPCRVIRRCALALAVLVPGVMLGSAPVEAARAPMAGEMYLVQGVVGSTWDFSVDGRVVGRDVGAKKILGGMRLEPGRHEVEATNQEGESVDAMVRVGAGQSVDVVLHLPVEARRQAVLTRFANEVAPVADGSTRLSVAHTAAVGPADIKVDGRTLFADVASGEELTVVVPADTYRVAVVPSTTDDPPVLGPVDLRVEPGTSTRVFAVGVAARGTMDAIVHTLPVPVEGSDEAPAGVPGGTGGQHDVSTTGPAPLAWSGAALLLGALVVGVGGRRRRVRSATS